MSSRPVRSGASLRVWYLVWLCWVLLLLQQLTDALLTQLPWIIWLGKLLPLLVFVPGLLRDSLRSYIWLCFICLLYFIALVERVFALPGQALAWLGLVAVVTLFCSAMLYVRWRARELRQPPIDTSGASL
ncbi:DUF2069 domain-containing protein [Kineobactrum salinum]|uniref:DUF2069 domain-containing protein n=1 Tax=Kineobactrum salinum TaxID=2708301 RepID=A0A6C0U3J3_9GAMM|nr:DUF2069 domain-containing protein [Kineobactrum salinum]QIB66661.1 DUF2069 domain-containing protein [Kineobactrum salinum]